MFILLPFCRIFKRSQDTGLLQADIIYMVADTKKNVCVVGDDDQSIYGFRGASVQTGCGSEKGG